MMRLCFCQQPTFYETWVKNTLKNSNEITQVLSSYFFPDHLVLLNIDESTVCFQICIVMPLGEFSSCQNNIFFLPSSLSPCASNSSWTQNPQPSDDEASVLPLCFCQYPTICETWVKYLKNLKCKSKSSFLVFCCRPLSAFKYG